MKTPERVQAHVDDLDNPETLISALRSQLREQKQEIRRLEQELDTVRKDRGQLRREARQLRQQLTQADPDGVLDQVSHAKRGMETLMKRADTAEQLVEILADESNLSALSAEDQDLLRGRVLSLTKENKLLRHGVQDRLAESRRITQDALQRADAAQKCAAEAERQADEALRFSRVGAQEQLHAVEAELAVAKKQLAKAHTTHANTAEEQARLILTLLHRVGELEQVVRGRLGLKIDKTQMLHNTCCRCGLRAVPRAQAAEAAKEFGYVFCEDCLEYGRQSTGKSKKRRYVVKKEDRSHFSDKVLGAKSKKTAAKKRRSDSEPQVSHEYDDVFDDEPIRVKGRRKTAQ